MILLITQPLLQHPPVLQLLAEFFGQFGENSATVLKSSAHLKLGFGAFCHKSLEKTRFQNFLGSPFVFKTFLS